MNVLFLPRVASTVRRLNGNNLAAGFALILTAVAVASCDSHDTTTTTAKSSPPAAAPGVDTDTSGGEPVALSQEELSAEYATLTGLVAEGVDGSIWRQFRAQQQVKLSVSGDRLVVNSTGDNPVIILPAFAAGQRFILEEIVESSNVTTAQLYYLTPGQSKYSEDQSQVVELKPGRNVVYFRIDDPNVIDPLRFDPASTPGTYTIERMTARGLPPETSE